MRKKKIKKGKETSVSNDSVTKRKKIEWGMKSHEKSSIRANDVTIKIIS